MSVYTKKSGQIQHHVLKSNNLSLPGYEMNLNKNKWKTGFSSYGLLHLKTTLSSILWGFYGPLKCSKEEKKRLKMKKEKLLV